MRILDRDLSRHELARRCGASTQLFGIQAAVLDDGVERGIRCLEFRTGAGLRFTVLIDRAFDVATLEYRGTPLGWHSPTGFRHPGLHEYNDEKGLSWLRSFSGFLVTGGLDHTLFMTSEVAEHYCYPPRASVDFTLHGRVSNIPGRLHGYGEEWSEGECTLWCEGTVQQATVFGENLHLVRRIEARVGDNSFTIRDRVINRGFCRTPHMLLYHINLGYPLLDQGSEYIAPIAETVWMSHAEQPDAQSVGYRTQPAPQAGFREQVFQHRLRADAQGRIPAALINRAYANGQGIGLVVEVNEREFPYSFQWQNFQEGLYAMAIEPSTNQVLGRKFAQERGELCWLDHGQERSYTTNVTVLESNAAIDQFVARVAKICEPPRAEYLTATGNWDAK